MAKNLTAQYRRIGITYDLGSKNRNQIYKSNVRVQSRTGKVQICEIYKAGRAQAETYTNLLEPVYQSYIKTPGFISPGL